MVLVGINCTVRQYTVNYYIAEKYALLKINFDILNNIHGGVVLSINKY